MTGEWNPRYANYARMHGRTPEEQLEQDKKDWLDQYPVKETQP